MTRPLVNLRDVPRERIAHGRSFDASVGRIGSYLGARRLGYSIVEVPPGKRACPYHTHHNIEEMFVVLEGAGTLRFGSDSHPIREGDVVWARSGDEPHQIVNASSGPLRYLCVSTIEETDVVDYPDAGKVGIAVGTGVSAPPRMHFIRAGREVGYWEGES